MANVYTACAGRVTIFSTGGKFRPVSKFYGVTPFYSSRPFLCTLVMVTNSWSQLHWPCANWPGQSNHLSEMVNAGLNIFAYCRWLKTEGREGLGTFCMQKLDAGEALNMFGYYRWLITADRAGLGTLYILQVVQNWRQRRHFCMPWKIQNWKQGRLGKQICMI